MLAPYRFRSWAEFSQEAKHLIDWAGLAEPYDRSGQYTASSTVAIGAVPGLFGIEPYRADRARFNIWLSTTPAPGADTWLHDPTLIPFHLPDQVVVVVARVPQRQGGEPDSYATLDPTFDGPGTPRRDGDHQFGSAVIMYDPTDPEHSWPVIAHELGHAMFALPDEYIGDVHPNEGQVAGYYPSCALTKTEAVQWWGDLIGQVAPGLSIYISEMAAAGQPLDPAYEAGLRRQLTVGYIPGGCYGQPGSLRPTITSIMFSATEVPVFGTPDQLWMQRVLDLWSGQ